MTNKDLIAQYVDTGLKLPEYQVKRLPNWAKKTYIRKRLISVNGEESFIVSLEEYEFNMLDDNSKEKYINDLQKRLNKIGYGKIKDYEFRLIDNKHKEEYLTKTNDISVDKFKMLTPESRERFVGVAGRRDLWHTPGLFEELTDKEKEIYASAYGETGFEFPEEIFDSLTANAKMNYLKSKISRARSNSLEPYEFEAFITLGDESELSQYAMDLGYKMYYNIPDEMFKLMPQKARDSYAVGKSSNLNNSPKMTIKLTDNQIELLSPDIKDLYLKSVEKSKQMSEIRKIVRNVLTDTLK